jgi:hypothetical protein
MDLGNKPVTGFKKHIPDTEDTILSHLLSISLPEHEGLQDDKPNTQDQQQTSPKYILPAHHRPTHHRPGLVRAIGCTTDSDGHLIRDPTFRGRRQLQLIACKHSTDENIQEGIDHIYIIYEPPTHALQTHGTIKADVIIIPIVIAGRERSTSKHSQKLPSSSPSKRNHQTHSPIINFQDQEKIAMAPHAHAQEWLSHISKFSRKILTTKMNPNPKPANN